MPYVLRGVVAAVFTYGALVTGARAQAAPPVATPQQFIYFGRDGERITEDAFLHTPAIVGAQLKYAWKELEPERDRYDLSAILNDLAYLEQHGKRLVVQLQDVSFEEAIINVPRYLLEDPAFGGGVARQYEYGGVNGTQVIPEGWVARRWDPAVRERFIRLLQVLGERLDGRIEGLNLPETAIGFTDSVAFQPPGFRPERYLEGVMAIMTAARQAFRQSAVIQYANFMPGEWLPGDDRGYLRGVYAHAAAIGMGVGGPDLLPHRRGQQTHSLPLIAARNAGIVAGVAVQWGNLDDIDPSTGRPVTVEDLYRYAREHLRVQYLFWGTQEPHYTESILPFLRTLPNP